MKFNNITNKNMFISALLVVSFVVNVIFLVIYFSEESHFSPSDSQYPLLSKRIFTQNPNDVIVNFVQLRKAIKEYVLSQNGDVGVYFEYLPSGISIGVNDREEVRLASLSKVPLVMSIYKKIEKGEIKPDETVILKKENLDTKFGSLWKKGEGAKISIKELIEESLINSDNTAYHTLLDLLTPNEVIDVYDNLEIEVNSKETDPVVSPKSYSSIFRSLYLSSYLSEENSNYILGVLTNTAFNDKIPAGVLDKNIKIAHKIGVFSRPDSESKLFSDCGIIYIPERPYILCIFVQESDEEARKHMAYISYMIYSYLMIVKGGE